MKILIIYASAGAGHKKAAEALYEAFCEKVDKKDLAIIDSLDYTNKFFKWMYAEKYLTLVTHLPNIWGFFYYLFDKPAIYRLLWAPRRFANFLNARPFEQLLLKERPEVVVTTHFMANEIVSRLKLKKGLDSQLYSAVTDFRLHSFWLGEGVNCYMVATPQTKKDLVKRGIDEKKTRVTGVPISPKFLRQEDRLLLCDKLGIERGLFTILIAGGGFGVGPIESLVRQIGGLSDKIQLLAVCGNNQFLQEKVKEIAKNTKAKVKDYGFVDNMHQLMQVSDILVSKSGGMTMSEALTKRLPIVVVDPIPGQEGRNSRALESYGAAFIVKNAKAARKIIKRLYENPDILEEAKKAAEEIARPNSAREIVDLIIRKARYEL